MSILIKNNAKIHENYTLNGQKENFLLITCHNCKEVNNDFYNNKKCIQCLFMNIYHYRNKNFKEVLIKSKNLYIKNDQLNQLLSYFKKLKTIKKILKKIQKFKEIKCAYKEFNCKISKQFDLLDKIQFLDPFSFYNALIKIYKVITKNKVGINKCKICIEAIISKLKSILGLLNNLEILRFYIKTENIDKQVPKIGWYHRYLFQKNLQINETIEKCVNQDTLLGLDLIKVYTIGTPPLYKISIFEEFSEYEKIYQFCLNLDSKSEEKFFISIIEDVIKNIESIEFDEIVSLPSLIRFYKNAAKKLLDKKYLKLNIEEKERLAYLTSLKILNLEKLFPLLIDDYVEEIFLDAPHDNIYLNHQEFGRCVTCLKLNMMELERIKTFLRIYSGQRLDYSNPSLKFVIKNEFFNCRFAIDVDPLQIDKIGLDIRKLNKNIFSIQDLLKNGTLNPEIAAFLYFCILNRINITVMGETDTGKTTLINTLDLMTPKDFRKIYIENTVESLNQRGFGKHQLKYLVDSDDNINLQNDIFNPFSKSNQIKTLLHRSPDLIYLGEILTKEEAQAMFHCLASGLVGFQTIHSNSLESLLNRLIYFFDIEPSCLNDLGIVIFMKKIKYKRILISVSEITFEIENRITKINTIFNYIPEKDSWDLKSSIFDTRLMEQLIKFENICENTFNNYLAIYNDIFTWLYNYKYMENDQLVSFFHKISFFSNISITKLENFWTKWKKTLR